MSYVPVYLTAEELEEILSVMAYVRDENFYGDPEKEPWNANGRSTFLAAFEKLKSYGDTLGARA